MTWLLIAPMVFLNKSAATRYLPCMCQWLSSKAQAKCATETYHRRDYMCWWFAYQSIAQSKYLLVEQERRCISTVSQTHKIPHTALIAAANGLVRVMAMVPGVAQSKYRFTFKAKTEPSIILRHWPCDLNMRKSVEHAGFTLALLSGSHHTTLAIICR